jgi:hypothetical protein
LLEEVQNLAIAEQAEILAEKEGLVRKAKKIFKVTLDNLPGTVKIIELVSKALQYFGVTF